MKKINQEDIKKLIPGNKIFWENKLNIGECYLSTVIIIKDKIWVEMENFDKYIRKSYKPYYAKDSLIEKDRIMIHEGYNYHDWNAFLLENEKDIIKAQNKLMLNELKDGT